MIQYAEEQANEVEALRAIYMADFTELPSTAVWKNAPAPPRFVIHLQPSSEYEGTGMEIDVRVAMTPTYPATLPEVTLENANALHPKQLEALKTCTKTTMRELRGSELVFEVTSNIQAMLDDYARKTLEAPSLEEDRRLREQQKQQKERERAEKERQEQAQRAAREEELFESQVLEELADLQLRQRETNKKKKSTGKTAEKITVFKPAITARQDSGAMVTFDRVAGNIVVPSPLFGHASLVRPLLKYDGPADMLLTLTRLEFGGSWWSTDPAAEKELSGLRYELEIVRQLRHPGVVPLLASRIDRLASGAWSVELLNSSPGLSSVDELLDAVGQVSVRVVRGWAIQLLEALEALHKAGVRHKCVGTTTVVLHRNADTNETSLLLTHPSYLHTLIELDRAHKFLPKQVAQFFKSHQGPWPPPEQVPSSKSDIWQFGILILQLIAGKDVVAAAARIHADPLGFVRSTCWPASFQAFLGAVFHRDSSRRPAALDLLTYQFLRSDDSSGDAAFSSSAQLSSPPASTSSSMAPNYSRYKSDFDEMAVLGRGGFGQVVKARNKLDGRTYAVKKIQATQRTLSQILQEVVLLSRLNHQYVVRYYSVWLENTGDEARPLGQRSQMSSSLAAVGRDQFSAAGHSNQSSFAPSASVSANVSMSAASFSRPGDFSLSDLDPPAPSFSSFMNDDFIQFGSDDSGTEKQSQSPRSQSPGTETRSQSPGENLSVQPRRRTPEAVPTTLYIQMEYCENHTLADLIKQGLYDEPTEYWRLFRQILEALAYIHNDGIIHRDLKPKNIFIDNARNIKIGDFGLAKSVVQSELTVTSTPTTKMVAGSEDMTTEVGTSLYAAVEVSSSSGRANYNEKVDMYSLGIIFFEMSYPMETEMERLRTIRHLRLPQIEVPAQFETKRYNTECSIVKSLLNHDPSKRPSASDLLVSGKIPVGDGELTIKEALRNLVNSNSVHQLTQALFSRPQEPAQQVLYDRQMGATELGRRENLRFLEAESRIRRVFRTFGAVEDVRFRPELFPRSPFYGAGRVVELLDPQGTILQLPCDLVLPHARRLAEVSTGFSKTFIIDQTYHPQTTSGPARHPIEHTDAAFDIVSTSPGTDLFEDAEAVAALGDVAAEFAVESLVVLSHSSLTEAILEFCGLTRPQFSAVLEFIDESGVAAFDLVKRRDLMAVSNISSASLSALEAFLFREPVARATQLLQKHMGTSFCGEAVMRITQVAELATRMAGDRRIVVAPLAHSRNWSFYDCGIHMQLVSVAPRSPEKILAIGGRYDALVRHFRHSVLDRNTPLARVVGFSVHVDVVHDCLEPSESRSRCQVLIASFNESTLTTVGVEILRLLRANGISADIARHARSSDQLVSAASEDNVPIVVVVKQAHAPSSSSFKPLRVKHAGARADVDMTIDELLSFALAESSGRRSTTAQKQPERPNSVPDLEDAPADAGPDKVIILSESGKVKGGRKNKWQVEETCREATAKYIAALGNAPAVTLDLRDDAIQAICSLSPHAVDDWKRRVVGLAPNHKAYIMSVQSRLSTEAGRAPLMLLYSTKTEHVFIYDTTK